MLKSLWTSMALGLSCLAAVFSTANAQHTDKSINFGYHQTPPRPAVEQATCAGIRGNGQNLFAHYGALARHVEEYGTIECVAGGSSGSITAFLVESMWLNPNRRDCGRRPCGKLARDARMSLMLKSVIGLTEAGLFEDAATVNRLVQGIAAGNINDLLNGPSPEEGVAALLRLLRDLGPLINKDLITLLETSPDPVFHAKDIIEGLEKGINFVVDDPRVFVRTSVLDFDEVANLFGLYGSFYAGYGPVDDRGFRRWLQACAKPGLGMTWEEVSALVGTRGQTCGDTLRTLFNEYRERVAVNGGRNRADDPVGKFIPSFGVTGVLKGEAITQWETARDAWLAAAPVPFEPDFDDVGVGYWGRNGELRKMNRKLKRRFADLSSRQFTPLGPATWHEVLASSPAEPGFSPAVPLSSGFLSVGGWADPLRILPLEALGAKKTIAINRLGGIGSFTADVTRLLNASEDEVDALYSTTDPMSTFYLSLEKATGVWCTDWDSQNGDPNMLFNDAYSSPFITEKRRFLRPRFSYPHVGPDFSIAGCVPEMSVSTIRRNSW